MRSLSRVPDPSSSLRSVEIFPEVLSVIFPKSVMLSFVPQSGSVRVTWEKLARPDRVQEIEIRISPDHLQACTDSGKCVEGCPAREIYLLARLLIRE